VLNSAQPPGTAERSGPARGLRSGSDLARQAVHRRYTRVQPHRRGFEAPDGDHDDALPEILGRNCERQSRHDGDGGLRSDRRWRGWSEQRNSTSQRNAGADDGVEQATCGSGSQAPIMDRRRFVIWLGLYR